MDALQLAQQRRASGKRAASTAKPRQVTDALQLAAQRRGTAASGEQYGPPKPGAPVVQTQAPATKQPQPKVGVMDVVREIPSAVGKVGKSIVNFFTGNTQKFVKNTGNRLGEALAQFDSTVREQLNGGNTQWFLEQDRRITEELKKEKKGSERYKRLQQARTIITEALADQANAFKEIAPTVEQTTGKKILGEAVGTFAELAPYAKGGLAVKAAQTVKGAPVTQTAVQLAKTGAKTGFKYGAGFGASEALQENQSVGSIITKALTSGATGAAVGAVVSPILGAVAKKMGGKAATAPAKGQELAQDAGTYAGGVQVPKVPKKAVVASTPKTTVKAGAQVLSPSLAKQAQEQAAMQIERDTPDIAARVRKVNLKGATNLPEVERRLMAALPDNPPQSSVDAIKNWTKMEQRVRNEMLVNIPAQKGEGVSGTLGSTKEKLSTTGKKIAEKAEKFTERVKQATDTMPRLSRRLEQTYAPITNEETAKRAAQTLKTEGTEIVRNRLMDSAKLSADDNAAGMLLVKQYQKQARYDDAVKLVSHMSEVNRKQGQAIQALAMYERLSPEGVLRFAQRQMDEASRIQGLIGTNKALKLTAQQAQKLSEHAAVLEAMPTGLPKTVETAKLLREVSDMLPTSVLDKLSTAQIFAQLINPKTIIRNTIGNTGFAVLENVTNPVRVAVDKATSVFTGQRTASFAGTKAQLAGAKKGAEIGSLEARYGVNLDDVATRFDLPKARAFKGRVGSFLNSMLDWGLRVPDKIGYQSAFEQRAAELQSLVKSGKSTLKPEQIAEMAHEYGLYRTFQDASAASKGAQGLKKVFNFGQKFGFGDIILKYPKTPGNILARAVDYSPLGFTKTIGEIAKPIMGKPFNQASFVDSLSRALVGSVGLVGTGAALKNVGVLTNVKRESDKDLAAFQRAEGTGPYRINVSALKRFITSGFKKDAAKLQENDKLVSYDWFQPQAVMLAIGARMADKEDKSSNVGTTILNSLLDGVNTIVEQPLLSGVRRMFQSGSTNPVAPILDAAIQAPASFIPTVLSQVNQLLDNKQRETFSNIWWQEMLYSAMAKVPGLAKKVPPRIDVFGREGERYQDGSNSIANVFFNPAFISTFKPTPMTREILDLYEKTGEKGHVPSLIAKKQQINGQSVELSPKQYEDYQRYVGGLTTKLFLERMGQSDWKNLEPLKRVDALADIVTNVKRAGKIKLLGDKQENVSAEVKRIMSLAQPNYRPYSSERERSTESEARSKSGIFAALKDYAHALKVDPGNTLRAILGPERFRKIRNDAVILERKNSIADLDLGDPNSAIDHVIPLGLGGRNNLENLQILTNDEKAKKDSVERFLINELDKGRINRREAQSRIRKWRDEYKELQLRGMLGVK